MAGLSGLEVLALVKEINAAVKGAYVNNIYSLGRAQVIRFRKPEEGDVWLCASPEFGVWVSESLSERAETTPFTTKLRKELERGRFVSMAQVDLDRVFVLTVEQRGSEKRVIFEMMPPGNVVVTDGEGVIQLTENEVRSSGRTLLRKVAYTPPASNRLSPASVSEDEIVSAIKGEKTAGRAIGRHVALPAKYVHEVLTRMKLEENSPAGVLDGRESELARQILQLVNEAGRSPSPCLCDTPAGMEIFAFAPRGFRIEERGKSVSALCDRVLLPLVLQAPIEPQDEVNVKRREMEITSSRLREQEMDLRKESAKIRSVAGEARAASSTLEAAKMLEGAGVTPTSPPGSPAAVASLLFDRAKELEQKADGAASAAERLEKQAKKLRPERKPTSRPLPRTKPEWFEKFRWFVTSGGRLAVGGRDAQSNSILVRRHLDAGDSVYHADLFGSPFFVLKGGQAQTEQEVREVAQATASFSSAWKTGLGSADAFWVSPDQVSSSAPSGEFLPKGSFMIRGKKNYVLHNPVEVAVGVDLTGRVVAGPETSLAQSKAAYVILRPHREKGSETAKRVRSDLQKLLPPESAQAISLDAVLRALPAGGGKVVRSKKRD